MSSIPTRILGGRKRLASEHGTGDALDGAMVLFHDVVQIFALADGDRCAVLCIVALDGRCIGRTPVDGDLLGHAMATNSLGEEAFRRLLVALCC